MKGSRRTSAAGPSGAFRPSPTIAAAFGPASNSLVTPSDNPCLVPRDTDVTAEAPGAGASQLTERMLSSADLGEMLLAFRDGQISDFAAAQQQTEAIAQELGVYQQSLRPIRDVSNQGKTVVSPGDGTLRDGVPTPGLLDTREPDVSDVPLRTEIRNFVATEVQSLREQIEERLRDQLTDSSFCVRMPSFLAFNRLLGAFTPTRAQQTLKGFV